MHFPHEVVANVLLQSLRLDPTGVGRWRESLVGISQAMAVDKLWCNCARNMALWKELVLLRWPSTQQLLSMGLNQMSYQTLCRSRALEEICIRGSIAVQQYILLMEATTTVDGVSNVAGSCAVHLDQGEASESEPNSDWERDGFVKLPLSFEWHANTSCSLEAQFQLQVSVLRTSDNKTAQLFNTHSQMCKTCWAEGWNDPTAIFWKQDVEGVIKWVPLKVYFGQSSTASYKNGQVKSEEELKVLRDPTELQSMMFHCFWIGFQLESKTSDNECALFRYVPGQNSINTIFDMANLSWH